MKFLEQYTRNYHSENYENAATAMASTMLVGTCCLRGRNCSEEHDKCIALSQVSLLEEQKKKKHCGAFYSTAAPQLV